MLFDGGIMHCCIAGDKAPGWQAIIIVRLITTYYNQQLL
jgi:hypothetical protein